MKHERRIIIERIVKDDDPIIWTYCTVCSYLAADNNIQSAIDDWIHHDQLVILGSRILGSRGEDVRG